MLVNEILATVGLFICTFSCAFLSIQLGSTTLGAAIILGVASAFFALACVIYASKLLAHFLPPKGQEIAQWIHAQCLEIFYILGAHCLFPLSIRNWKWNQSSQLRPILLVHGYMNYNAVWLYHGKKFKESGLGPIYTINLGHPFHSIEQYAEKVKRKAEQISKETQRKDLVLIGHSMGGLVSSYYATELAETNTVTDVITIGSPLNGTRVAKIGVGKCASQMNHGSEFVTVLSEKILTPSDIRFYHIATKSDQLVIPYQSGLLGDDAERHFILNNIGHVALLFSEKVNRKIINWISNQ